VQELKSHGGSLRIFACHADYEANSITDRVSELLEREKSLGFDKLDGYSGFEDKVRKIKQDLLSFLIEAKRAGKTVVAYGAPGKGNTLLNYCGIRQDFLDYAADRSDYKEGMYTPGTHIPIYKPDRIRETKPDYILILPWNLKKEITQQLSYAKEWGAEFVVPIPKLERI
jgi:hypothetical protein